ncbi:MAG: hypothetical protein RLZ79_93 [Pseudomonadota bacterium]|jgi:hypothetical protein
MTQTPRSINRRSWLAGSLILGAGVGAESSSAISSAAVAVAGSEPDTWRSDEQLRNLVRMQGSLLEEDVRWWFTGVIFGVRGEGETPRPLVRFEGTEVYWFSHRGDDFQLGGHTVTFFRDFETGEFLYEFINPYTGKRESVKPAVQGGNLGFAYTRQGIWPVRLDGTPLAEPVKKPLRVQWHEMGPHIWLQHQTVYPPGMPAMHGQRQTIFAQRDALRDPRQNSVPASFSSVVFMNWLKWMDMKDQPGHVIWHASGVKLQSMDQLPRAYRERAEKEYPDRLSARPVPR